MELYAYHHGDAGGGQLVHSGEQFVLPEPIYRALIAATSDILYVIWTNSQRVISLNVERRIFRRLADLHWWHVLGGTTVLAKQVYITGGTEGMAPEGESKASSTVEVYDSEMDCWTEVTPMTQARSSHGCVTIRMR